TIPSSAPLGLVLKRVPVPEQFSFPDEEKVTTNDGIATTTALSEWCSKLSKIVADIVGHKDLSLNNSLFSYGVDSMGVIRIAQILRKQFDMNVSYQEIMQCPTIQMMANLCAQRECESGETQPSTTAAFEMFESKWKNHVCHELDIAPENVEAIYPCTPTQAAMVARTMRDSKAYFNAFVFELTSGTNVDRLKEAWVAVIGQTEILRTSFLSVDDEHHPFVQVVCRNTSVSWSEHYIEEIDVDVKDIINMYSSQAVDELGNSLKTCLMFKVLRLVPSNTDVVIAV
ncbi:hypothetical protein HDV05_001355, partial [Chytridiales sp. JEL 0842]